MKETRPNLIKEFLGKSKKDVLRTVKNRFVSDLQQAMKNEEEYCKDANIEPVMPRHKRKVLSMLEKCKDVFEVEAMAQFIFEENIIPTENEIKGKAKKLRDAFPLKKEIM